MGNCIKHNATLRGAGARVFGRQSAAAASQSAEADEDAPPAVPDTSEMDMEQVFRLGIAEAQMATEARSLQKRDRLQHIQVARELLKDALRRCKPGDEEKRAHLYAVLAKLGEDARSLKGGSEERRSYNQVVEDDAGNASRGLPSNPAGVTSGPGLRVDVMQHVQAQDNSQREVMSDHSSEDVETPQMRLTDLSEMGSALLEDSDETCSLPSPGLGPAESSRMSSPTGLHGGQQTAVSWRASRGVSAAEHRDRSGCSNSAVNAGAAVASRGNSSRTSSSAASATEGGGAGGAGMSKPSSPKESGAGALAIGLESERARRDSFEDIGQLRTGRSSRFEEWPVTRGDSTRATAGDRQASLAAIAGVAAPSGQPLGAVGNGWPPACASPRWPAAQGSSVASAPWPPLAASPIAEGASGTGNANCASGRDSKEALAARQRGLQPQQPGSAHMSKRRRGASGEEQTPQGQQLASEGGRGVDITRAEVSGKVEGVKAATSLTSRHTGRQPSQSSSSGSQGTMSDSEGSVVGSAAKPAPDCGAPPRPALSPGGASTHGTTHSTCGAAARRGRAPFAPAIEEEPPAFAPIARRPQELTTPCALGEEAHTSTLRGAATVGEAAAASWTGRQARELSKQSWPSNFITGRNAEDAFGDSPSATPLGTPSMQTLRHVRTPSGHSLANLAPAHEEACGDTASAPLGTPSRRTLRHVRMPSGHSLANLAPAPEDACGVTPSAAPLGNPSMGTLRHVRTLSGTSLANLAPAPEDAVLEAADVRNPLALLGLAFGGPANIQRDATGLASPSAHSHCASDDSLSLAGSCLPSAAPSPFCHGAVTRPLVTPTLTPATAAAAELINVRILNGVNGEEEVRFTLSVQGSFSEQHFLSLLDRRCQQLAGQALKDLNWLHKKTLGDRFQRRQCDVQMVEEIFGPRARQLKGPTVLMLCTVPVRPPSELPASKVKLKKVNPERITGGQALPAKVTVTVETSPLESGHEYTVAFTHQWSNQTYTAEATLLDNNKGVQSAVPWHIFAASSSINPTDGLYDIHLIIDRAARSDNRRTLTVVSAESEMSSSSATRSSAPDDFAPIGE